MITPGSPQDTVSDRPAPLAYLAAGLICMAALTWALRLDQADWKVPLYYTIRGDAFEHAMWLRATADQGWYLHDPRLGAPEGMDLHDYPLSDSLHFAMVRIISQFTPHYGVVINLFYVLGYPLAAWTTLYALRRFGINPLVATVAAVLYAFLPYHFLRGQGHILLSGYYGVPLMCVVLLRIWRGEPLFGSWKEAFFTMISCAILPATGVYYAFFGGFLALVALVASLSRQWSWKRVFDVAGVGVLLGGSLAAQISPSILYMARHGRSPEIARRTAWEAEHFGLKIHQLLMPTLGHRLPQLQKFGVWGVIGPGEYQKISMNDVNENETSSLGVIGVLGFFAVLASLLVCRTPTDGEESLLIPLSRLTVASIVLATVGGVGVVFSRLVSSQIRAYNRISVYIAFFALFAVAMGLDALRKRMNGSTRNRVAFTIVAGLILAAGIWDQSPSAMTPDHAKEQAAFARDAAFVRTIETELADRPVVFQLPYVPFPESLPVNKMRDYDHLWGYFHSDRLRWSYGAIKGRPNDLWQRATAKQPVDEMLATLDQKGFGGITVDRHGYADGGAAVEAELTRALGVEPIVGPGGRIVLFKISDSKFARAGETATSR